MKTGKATPSSESGKGCRVVSCPLVLIRVYLCPSVVKIFSTTWIRLRVLVLPPLSGLVIPTFLPRLTPWATFFRTYGAGFHFGAAT